MVILITGASHTGKTKLAQVLVEKLHYSCLSIDHLKMGLIRSGATALTPEDDGQLTAYLWPIVREMIKTAIENGQNLIVEGCYVPFDWKSSFSQDDLPHIQYHCLAMTDAYIDARFAQIQAHASDVEKRGDDSGCVPERLKTDNQYYIAGCRAAGNPLLLIHEDYEKEMAAAFSWDAGLLASHCVFPTPDIGRTADYYEKTLGFQRVEYLRAQEKHVCLYRDNVEFILTQADGPRVRPNREVYGYGGDAYVIARDLQCLQDEFEAKGVKLVQRLHQTDYQNREFVIEDIDGRWIYFGVKEEGARPR